MRFLRGSLVGLMLLGLTLGLLALAFNSVYSSIQDRMARDQAVRPQRERVLAANVVAAELVAVRPKITTFGEIQSVRTLDLRAPASGLIVELSPDFVEGGIVNAGETILEVDPSDAQSARDVAVADKNEAKFALNDAERSLELANDELVGAREQADLRQKSLERQEKLLESGIGTNTAVENAKIAFSSANQSVLSIRKAVAQAESRVEQARSLLERREIKLAELQRNLDKTRLVAEFSGALSNVSVVKGGLVSVNERIARLIDPDALEVSFRVSSTQYSRLLDKNGNLIPAEMDLSLDIAGSSLSAKARIVRESAVVAEGQTGHLVFARIDDGNTAGLRPGDFVTVSVSEPELKNVVILPATSVDSNSEVLAVGEDGRLEQLNVEILRKQGDEVIARGRGLRDRLIVANRSPTLGSGIKIKPVQSGEGGIPEEKPPSMIEVSESERQELIKMVEANKFMPAGAKERVIKQLNNKMVPQATLDRLRSRMGG